MLEMLMIDPLIPASRIRTPTYFEHNQAPSKFVLNTLSHSSFVNSIVELVLPDQNQNRCLRSHLFKIVYIHIKRLNVLEPT